MKAGINAPPRTFGFHTFRRTLASVLVANNVDPKVVQEVLRHQGIRTTLELYAKTIGANKLEAQGMFLTLLFGDGERERERQQLQREPSPAAVSEMLKTMPSATRSVQ